jgi:hypothetical protein
MRHLYARSVTSMDSWIATLLSRLDEQRLLEDTAVIVTSDHGENLGEGQLIGHAFSLDQRLVHVPLVIAGPDAIDLPPLFSTMHLPGLIGDIAGLTANPWVRDAPVLPDGVAVAQYDAIIGSEDPRLEQITRLWSLDEDGRSAFCQPMTAATDGHRMSSIQPRLVLTWRGLLRR